jgi:cupin superfamily acireductone dioxygenase involved in methionine salvage
MRTLFTIILICLAGYGIYSLADDNGYSVEIQVEKDDVTINDPSDIKEYILGLKNDQSN